MSDISPARTNERSLLGRERSSWHPWAGAKNPFPSPPMPPPHYFPPWPFPGRCPCLRARSFPRPVLFCRPRCFFWCVQGKKGTFFPSPFPDKQTVKLLFAFLLLRPFHPALPNETLFCRRLLLRPWLLLSGRVGCGRGEGRKREKSCPKKCYLSPFFPFRSCPPRPNLEKGRWQRGRTRPAGSAQGKRRKADKLNPSVSVQISCKGSPQKRTYSILTGKIVAQTIFYSVFSPLFGGSKRVL